VEFLRNDEAQPSPSPLSASSESRTIVLLGFMAAREPDRVSTPGGFGPGACAGSGGMADCSTLKSWCSRPSSMPRGNIGSAS
jgi:hypothetical protein